MARLGTPFGLLVPLALLGLAAPALAQDIADDTSGLRASVLSELDPGIAHRAPDRRTTRVRKQTVNHGGRSVTRVQGQRQGDRSRAATHGPDRDLQRQMGRQRGSHVFGSNGTTSFDHKAGDRQKRRGVLSEHADAGRVQRSFNGHVEKVSGNRSTVRNTNGAVASRGETNRLRVHGSGPQGRVQTSRETLSTSHSARNRAGPPPHTPGQAKSRPGSSTPARVQPARPGGRAPGTITRPSTGPRPGTPARPAAPARPGTLAARPPARPGTIARPPRVGVVSRPGPVRVTTVSRPPTVQVVRYRTVRPYHGVFVYGPRPVSHTHYAEAPPARGHRVERSDLPDRKIDRDNSFALGLRMGSLISGYDEAAGYADLGFGGTVRFRPDEAVGLELAVSHFNQTFDNSSERGQTLTSGSVELFAFPWARISPYVIGGVTWAAGGFDDDVWTNGKVENISLRRTAFGPHGGLGVEFALGQDVALDLEARYVGFLGHNAEDPTLPGGLTTTAGVLFHF